MAITGQTNLDAANTAFNTSVQAVLDGQTPIVYPQFCAEIPADGTSVELLVADGVPVFREWFGAKQYNDIRVYKRNYPARQWEATFSLPGLQFRQDKTGLLAQQVGQFGASLGGLTDKVVIEALFDNPTGYDGVSLLNDSHPNQATGATSDNLSTSALSFSVMDTAIQSLEEMANENGKYLGLRASHLLVGTAQKRVGMELTGSDRPYSVATDAALNSGGIGAVNLENFQGGPIELMVSPYITGNEWALMALNIPGVRPFGLATFDVRGVVEQTDLTDTGRFETDEYRWSLEADMSPIPMAWQCIYGSVTA